MWTRLILSTFLLLGSTLLSCSWGQNLDVESSYVPFDPSMYRRELSSVVPAKVRVMCVVHHHHSTPRKLFFAHLLLLLLFLFSSFFTRRWWILMRVQ